MDPAPWDTEAPCGGSDPSSVGGLSQRPPTPGCTSAGRAGERGWDLSCWSSVPEWLPPPTLRLASLRPLWEPPFLLSALCRDVAVPVPVSHGD